MKRRNHKKECIHEKDFIRIRDRLRCNSFVFKFVLDIVLFFGGVFLAQRGKMFIGGIVCGCMFIFFCMNAVEYLFPESEGD